MTRDIPHPQTPWLINGNHSSKAADSIAWVCLAVMLASVGVEAVMYDSVSTAVLIINPLAALIMFACGIKNRNILHTFFLPWVVGFCATFGVIGVLMAH